MTQSAFDPRLAMQRRRPGLDLLRALAIILVVVYHAGLFGFGLPYDVQRFGWIGVDLFFVLSGYLIAGQLFESIRKRNEDEGRSQRQRLQPDFSIPHFYERRALRILPAYFAIVAIYFFLPPTLREYERMLPVWKFLTFTQNLGLRGGVAFSHAWSLCIEFQFYLVLPLLIAALAYWARRRTAPPAKMSILFVTVACVPLIWCMVIRGILAHTNLSAPTPSWGWWQQWIYYPTYSRLDALTIGVGLAAIESFRPKWWNALMQSARWIWLPGLGGIVIALVLAEDGLSIASCSLGFFLVAIGMGTFLICAVSPRLPLSRVAIPGAAFLATTAYSVYLTHKLPIHWIQDAQSAHAIAVAPAYLVMLMSILIVGSAMFFAVERPSLKLRQKMTKKNKN